MTRMVKKTVCMLLAALFVMACVNITGMKTANAEIIVVSPKAGDRIPLHTKAGSKRSRRSRRKLSIRIRS